MPSKIIGNVVTAIRQQDRAIRDEWAYAMANVATALESRHTRLTRKWRHKPKFTQTFVIGVYLMIATVQPSGENRKYWLWVDRGTKPHIIQGNPYLRFRTGYQARTSAGPPPKSNVGNGTASGGHVTKQTVQHPGTKARRFGREIAKLESSFFVQEIEDGVRRGLAASR